MRVRDRQFEVFGHLVLVEHGSDGEADLPRAAQRLGLAGGGGGDLGQIALGGGEQVLALAGAFSWPLSGLRQTISRSPGSRAK